MCVEVIVCNVSVVFRHSVHLLFLFMGSNKWSSLFFCYYYYRYLQSTGFPKIHKCAVLHK